MSDYGFRVSQPGYNVLTDNDSRMMVTSKINNAKIVKTMHISINNSGGSWVYSSQNHGLGYVPFFLSFYYENGWWYPIDEGLGAGHTHISSTQVTCGAGPGYNMTFIMFLLAEPVGSGTGSQTSTADYGLGISKSGVEATTVSHDQDWIFTSKFPSLNVLFQGTLQSGADGHAIFTYPNGDLGYAPMCLVWAVIGGVRYSSPTFATGANGTTFSISSSELDVYAYQFSGGNPVPSSGVNFEYMVLQNKLSTS